MKRARFSEKQIIGVLKEAEAGAKTPAEIAGERAWRHAARHVTITSNHHHEGAKLYL